MARTAQQAPCHSEVSVSWANVAEEKRISKRSGCRGLESVEVRAPVLGNVKCVSLPSVTCSKIGSSQPTNNPSGQHRFRSSWGDSAACAVTRTPHGNTLYNHRKETSRRGHVTANPII
ncbi:hypothetical protein Q9233_006794 [Columba guinea]|nr:hypothetical protein Q9233_006794 [Columba guinea]